LNENTENSIEEIKVRLKTKTHDIAELTRLFSKSIPLDIMVAHKKYREEYETHSTLMFHYFTQSERTEENDVIMFKELERIVTNFHDLFRKWCDTQAEKKYNLEDTE
jgi:hypothetical protein